MNTSLAVLICSVGITGLFFLDSDKSVRNSPALWLPVTWLWINGSRSPSAWLGVGHVDSAHTLDATLEGNPMDAAVYAVLLAIGIAVLIVRRKKTRDYLSIIAPLIIFFIYCLLSVAWSPFPGPAFKRWTKAIGDVVMVLVILTDGQPVTAIRRIFSRVGFILLPFSITLIRWSDIGRGFDLDGSPSNTGVTTNKNALGVIAFVISLGALWNVCWLFIHKDEPKRSRRLVAQITLLVFGLMLLQMAHSSTCVACFILGSFLVLAGTLPSTRRRPARLNSLFLFIILAGVVLFLSGGQAMIARALGRKPDLTGRTEIWQAASKVAGFTLLGTGFESFWNAHALAVAVYLEEEGFVDQSNLVSAHNGYLEVYCDLGLIGLCLIVFILLTGFRRACTAVRGDVELGSLFLAFMASATIYSITEAGFRMLTPTWTILVLAIVAASGVCAGLLSGPTLQTRTSRGAQAGAKRAPAS